MSSTDSLAIFTRAAVMLAEADTLQKAKELKSLALTAGEWAKRKGMGEEAILHCRSYALEAERKMGEMLAQTERAKGAKGNPKGRGAKIVQLHGDTAQPTLKEIGLSRRESAEAQMLAELPAVEFDKLKSGKTTKSKVRKERKKQKQATANKAAPQIDGVVSDLSDLEGKKFRCIYADPPWAYDNQSTRASTDNHYSTLTLDELCKLPVANLAEDNCHLHLWTTNGFLFESQRLMEAWGFEFKSSFVWVKPQIGIGNYWRCSHEFLLLGVRGNLTAQDMSLKSWGEFKRRAHSAKPEEVRGMIERLSPGPYLELYGRARVKNWMVFGNQVT